MSDRPPPDPFAPARLGPLTLRNRTIKAATFEGVMRNGAVSDELIEFHRRVAAGGVGMTTVAYCAVSRDGRVQRHTLVMEPERVPDLTRLTEAVHSEGAAIQAQLGHAGLVANTRSNGMPTLAPSTRFSAPAMARVRGATPEQLDRVVDDFATALGLDRFGNRRALEFGCHQRLQSRPIAVGVLGRLPMPGHLTDERLGHRHLGRAGMHLGIRCGE